MTTRHTDTKTQKTQRKTDRQKYRETQTHKHRHKNTQIHTRHTHTSSSRIDTTAGNSFKKNSIGSNKLKHIGGDDACVW